MYRKFVLLTLVLILGVLASGIYVRATGSGLACPEFSTCYGYWWPPENLPAGVTKQYPGLLYQAAMARTLMLHRFGAVLVGLVLLGLTCTAWWQAKRRVAIMGSLGLLILYLLQGGLAAGVDQSRLMPVLVAAHWLVAVVMLTAGLVWYMRLSPADDVKYQHTVGLHRYAVVARWVTLFQLVLGTWVGVNHATLVCPDFPTCQGAWFPSPIEWDAFSFWRQWEHGLTGWTLPDLAARLTIHWIHRLGALVAFVILFGLGIRVSSNPKVPHLSKVGLLLSFLLLVEVTLGMSLVVKGAPAELVVAHGVIGVVLFLTVCWIDFYLRQGPPIEAMQPSAEVPMTPPPEVPLPEVVEIPPRPVNLYERLKGQLDKTRRGLTGFLATMPLAGKTLDEDLLIDIETHLLMADVGVEATQEIIQRLTARLQRHQFEDSDEVKAALHDILLDILAPISEALHIDPNHQPFVILVVGVNGVGKTTTIGKLAKRLQNQGHSVMLAAGDTFRAAAVEQLKIWGERNQVPVVAQEMGADSASVIFDALQASRARGIDVLIADTAGRLHTKSNLMEELAKIKRIMAKIDPSAPHEILLVLDSTTGQNSIMQAEQFNQAVGVTGIALTKLDGTAKGGVIFALAKRFGIPIRFIGIGEGMDDLQDFDARTFVDALFAWQPREEVRVLH